MDAQRRNNIHRRQFGGILTDLFPPLGTTTSTTSTTSSTSTTTSANSASTSTTSSDTTTSASSTSTTSTTSSTTTAAPSSTPTHDPTTVANSNTITVFQIASGSPSSTPSPSTTAVAAANQSFLENKALSGIVFALVGVIGLVLIMSAATFMIRRKRNNKLLNEALSFDPVNMGNDAPNLMETGRRPTNEKTRSSISTGHASQGNGLVITHTGSFSDYALPPMPYTPSTPQQRSYLAVGAQPFSQSRDWTTGAAPPYSEHAKQGSIEDEKSRRSGSSSGEFQFAAPVNVSGARR